MRFIEEKTDARERQIALAQLERVLHFAESAECRRAQLLAHLGEELPGRREMARGYKRPEIIGESLLSKGVERVWRIPTICWLRAASLDPRASVRWQKVIGMSLGRRIGTQHSGGVILVLRSRGWIVSIDASEYEN
jgi:hypothetical protein